MRSFATLPQCGLQPHDVESRFQLSITKLESVGWTDEEQQSHNTPPPKVGKRGLVSSRPVTSSCSQVGGLGFALKDR
jgi:hypothetical protein